MLEIPRTITVLGQRFVVVVEVDPDAALDPRDPETFQAHGACDRGRQIIRLRGPAGVSEDKARETLLHETLHAVIGTARIPPFGDEHGGEEDFVSMLAPLLLDTLRDNPDLVRALLAPNDIDATVVAHGEMVHDHAD